MLTKNLFDYFEKSSPSTNPTRQITPRKADQSRAASNDTLPHVNIVEAVEAVSDCHVTFLSLLLHSSQIRLTRSPASQFPPSPSLCALLQSRVPISASTMNAFRLAGDMTHLISILVLLLKIYATKSCSGIHHFSHSRSHFRKIQFSW